MGALEFEPSSPINGMNESSVLHIEELTEAFLTIRLTVYRIITSLVVVIKLGKSVLGLEGIHQVL